MTKKRRAEFQEQLVERNRKMKRAHRHDEIMTLGQYIDWVHGKKKKEPRGRLKNEYKPNINFRRDDHSSIPSLDSGCDVAARRQSPKYTGTYVKGISVTHKSNLVPITNEQQAKDIAKMRR